MMNTKRSVTWLTVLSLLFSGFLISCSEDIFETPIGGRIVPEDHYRSELDALLSYAGCFVYLQEIAENQVLVDGLRSDQMNVTDRADKDMIDISMHELSPDNPYIDPSNYYKLIINVNEVLPNLPQILELDRDFDSLSLYTFEGALVTLRSWAYFMLAKLNGEVGLISPDIEEFDPSDTPEYLSKEEIIDKLIQELLVYDDPKDIVRFTVDHYVLLGELYLEKEDYDNAVKYLKFACDGPAYRRVFMVDDAYQQEAWRDIFLNSTDQFGTVFTAVPYSFVDGQKNTLEEWMHPDYDYMVKPATVLIDSFAAQVQQNGDPSDETRGMGVSIDTTNAGSPYINKYSIDGGIPHSADIILYRAADVHMLLAEALNRTGEHDLAMVLLNDGIASLGGERPSNFVKWSPNRGVRGRAYLENKVIPPSDTANPMLYIEDLIIQERAMELAFEGKRWFDLVRIATRRGEPEYLADKVASKFEDPATADAIRNKLLDPVNWYLPLTKIGTE
ncbi:MAG: RagB/SusD family nutrient uptake outer membrane protein [Bacteroidales bacterium]|nr:RagB/SusD family nutrient uptake outer membrane protein [Bacteroidales bacterium]